MEETLKFETGKTYIERKHYGCGYDYTEYELAFTVVKRNEKSIWLKVKSRLVNEWGTPVERNWGDEETLKAKRIKISHNSKESYEYFKHGNDLIFRKYTKEISEN